MTELERLQQEILRAARDIVAHNAAHKQYDEALYEAHRAACTTYLLYVGEELPCLLCGGPLELQGTLGFREWFRCLNCGMDYGREIPRPPTQEIDP